MAKLTDKISVPAYVEGDDSTIIRIPGGPALCKMIRNGGSDLLRLHATSPADAAEQAKGWPLNPHATIPEQGEAFVFDEDSGAHHTWFVTSDAGTDFYLIITA